MTPPSSSLATAAQPLAETAHDPLSRERFAFDHPWFEAHREDWEHMTQALRGRPIEVLEIGSFEGASTTWMLDHLLDHPDSRMVAVDTFGGGIDTQNNPFVDLSKLERRFFENVDKCENRPKLRQMKTYSETALLQLRNEKKKFDLIYIDGSHVAIDVLGDAINAWSMLKMGGQMVFDDFRWSMYDHEAYCPQIAIVSFLRCAAPYITFQERSRQIWTRRVPTHIPAVRRPLNG